MAAEMIAVFPSWNILSWLQMLPHTSVISTDGGIRFQRPLRNTYYWIRYVVFSLLFFFLFFIMCQDFILLFNENLWKEYIDKGNKIINLLRELKTLFLDWKNWTSILLFVCYSGRMRLFIHDIRRLAANSNISERDKLRQRRSFAVIFCVTCIASVTRLLIGMIAYVIEEQGDVTKWIPHGLWSLPIFGTLIVDGAADLVGELLTLAVYVQIAAFTNVLVLCGRSINEAMSELNDSLIDRENGVDLPTFRRKIREHRETYEEFLQLFNSFERLFSLQLAFGVNNHGMAIFGAVAAIFKSDRPNYYYICQALSCVTYLSVMLMITVYPIRLHEEASETGELLQEINHKYLAIRRTHKISRDSSQPWAQDSFVLNSFLQRATTKPLVVTASGFGEINRSFLISLVTAIIGFTLFLLQQSGGDQARPCEFENATSAVLDAVLMRPTDATK